MRVNIIYLDQTAVRLILETNVDLEANAPAAEGIKIWFKRPDGTTGSWLGAILTAPGDDGDVYVDFTSAIKFNQSGDWVVWAEVTFVDGRVGYGKPRFYNVREKGTVSS